MSKPCSDKSKNKSNPQYACNPVTGKWTLKPEFKVAKVGCSPKSKFINDPRYECGPKGRYVLKKGFKSSALPGAPKAPHNGYMIFMNENRPAIKAELMAQGNMGPKGTGPSVTDVARAGGLKWKALGPSGQAPYKAQFISAQAAFKPAMAAFKASHGGVAKAVAAKSKKDLSAYSLWYKHKGFPAWKVSLPTGTKISITEAAKVLGPMWKKLPESEKAQFHEMAAKVKAAKASA